jgi:hypothetical protein
VDPGVELPPCPEGFYCAAFVGMCRGAYPIPGTFIGYCTPIPEECPGDVDEVCGCDDVTYDNECVMDMARAGVQFHDACDSTCTSSADCGEGKMCASADFFEEAPGACDLSEGGRCMDFSRLCELSLGGALGPVCGCDGQTYDSLCDALLEGRTNIAALEPCQAADGGV